jgi:hypothetical protein
MTSEAARPERLRALFVSYASAGTAGPAMMGVLKRVARLLSALPSQRVASHWLHFGPLTDDPLVRRLAPRIGVHTIPGYSPELEIQRVLSRVAPHVVVLGEGPGGGMMEVAADVANASGLPLACIENYYSPDQPSRFADASPTINQWLLLGLPDGTGYGKIAPRFFLAPPLIRPGSTRSEHAPTLAILGYDEAVKEAGLELLNRLPPDTSACVVSPSGIGVDAAYGRSPSTRPHASIALPDDETLSSLLAGARVVVCKSGFQQMAEALALGTPCIAISAAGAVPAPLLVSHLKPYVRYRGSTAADLTRVLAALAGWLVEKPVMPWSGAVAEIEDPARWAAAALVDILDAAVSEGPIGSSNSRRQSDSV